MNKDKENDISQTLGLRRAGRRSGRLGWAVTLVVAIALGVGMFALMQKKAVSSSVRYRSVEAYKGDISVTVTAVGTLEPTNQVDVGSELSGIVRSVEVEDNDQVEVGRALARLDTTKLMAQNRQVKAALKSAEAKVLQAKATLREAEGNLGRLKRVHELSGRKIPSQAELDAAEAALDRARADAAGAEASVEQAKANLEANETDLGKAVIRSPINGVVLIRNVEPGQTVAASLQAPVLFTLAEDLTRMDLHVGVDEADVGQVRAGQQARFTVDAYPERDFPAAISQVRYGSQTVEGVVTYETILQVENRDLLLRPGMTATAEITVKTVRDALLIPNAALRFAPPVEVKEESPSEKQSLMGRLFPRPHRRRVASGHDRGPRRAGASARVWTLDQGSLRAVAVETGLTDGAVTEATGGNVLPGMPLVVDTVRAGG